MTIKHANGSIFCLVTDPALKHWNDMIVSLGSTFVPSDRRVIVLDGFGSYRDSAKCGMFFSIRVTGESPFSLTDSFLWHTRVFSVACDLCRQAIGFVRRQVEQVRNAFRRTRRPDAHRRAVEKLFGCIRC